MEDRVIFDIMDDRGRLQGSYLYFWQRYKGVTKRDKNVMEDKETDRQRDRQTDRGTQLNFNIDYRTVQCKIF